MTALSVAEGAAETLRLRGPAPTEAVPGSELECLARAIYFEARSEPVSGQLAVGRVIINRTRSAAYPATVCGVVYQNAEKRNACQFSFACDNIPDDVNDQTSWQAILARAAWLLDCRLCAPLDGAGEGILISTNYHADYVSPTWAGKLQRTGQIGRHIFYYEAALAVPRDNCPETPHGRIVLAELAAGNHSVVDTPMSTISVAMAPVPAPVPTPVAKPALKPSSMKTASAKPPRGKAQPGNARKLAKGKAPVKLAAKGSEKSIEKGSKPRSEERGASGDVERVGLRPSPAAKDDRGGGKPSAGSETKDSSA